MATVRGSRFVAALVVALLGTFIVLASGTSFGQDRHKISWTAKAEHTKFPFRQRFEIPDIPGHAIVFFEIRRTWPDGGGHHRAPGRVGWVCYLPSRSSGLDAA